MFDVSTGRDVLWSPGLKQGHWSCYLSSIYVWQPDHNRNWPEAFLTSRGLKSVVYGHMRCGKGDRLLGRLEAFGGGELLYTKWCVIYDNRTTHFDHDWDKLFFTVRGLKASSHCVICVWERGRSHVIYGTNSLTICFFAYMTLCTRLNCFFCVQEQYCVVVFFAYKDNDTVNDSARYFILAVGYCFVGAPSGWQLAIKSA